MKTKLMNQRGFTLIELLVVIAIIAILASVSVPVFQSAQLKGAQSKAMQQATGIFKGLRTWSIDEEGLYPEGDDANQAFAQMFPDFGSEDPFYVSKSAYHGSKRGEFFKGPDNLWGEDVDGSGGSGLPLEPGENHWAYNLLADSETEARLPVIADGFTSAIGTYTADRLELGGIWRGKTCIVVYADGKGKVEKLDDQYKLVDKNNKDQFSQNGVEMVNPARPSN